MSNPTIIFCPKEKATALSELTGFFVMTPSSVNEGLVRLRNGGTIIVSDKIILLIGWTAPLNTQMVFVEGFPGPGTRERIQAEGRVWRSSKYPQDTPHHIRLKLDKRIRDQRIALRTNWEIVEQRAKFATRYPPRFIAKVMKLCDRFGIPRKDRDADVPAYERLRRLETKFSALKAEGEEVT